MTALAMSCMLLLGGCGSSTYKSAEGAVMNTAQSAGGWYGSSSLDTMAYAAAGDMPVEENNEAVYDEEIAPMDQEATYVPCPEDFDTAFGYDGGQDTETPTETTTTETKENESRTTSRKLIKTVDMSVETKEFDQTLDTIQKQVDALGGYIENMNTYNGSMYSGYRGSRDASLVMRIPKDNLDAFLEEISQISNVINRTDNVEDITLQYVDLESHRDALRTEQSRLLELLEQAETVEDIITIEDRLSDVRYQLESMESTLRTYDNQVDYSTVTVDITEVRDYTPVEKDSPWQRITKGFTESLKSIGNGFVDFGVWFLVHIPYLIIWAIVIVLLVLIIKKIIKKRRAKKAKKMNPVPEAPKPPKTES